MDNIQLNITKLQAYFEELEKRIKSIERQFTTTNQITAMQSCLSEIKLMLEEYQTSYNNLISDYNTHIQNFNTHESTNSLEHTNINNSITSINADLTSLQGNIENLISRVSILETTGGSSSGDSNCFCGNNSDYCHNYVNSYLYGNKFYSPKFLLITNSSQYVDIKLKVRVKNDIVSQSGLTYSINLVCNDQTVATLGSQKYITEIETKELSYRLYPTQNANYVQLYINAWKYMLLIDYQIEINGRDVLLDATMPSINISCFDDKYYIVKWDNETAKIYYDIQDKANLSLDESTMKVDQLTNETDYSFIDMRLVPALKEAKTYTFSTEYPQNINLLIINQENARMNYSLKLNAETQKFKKESSTSLSANRFDASSCLNGYGFSVISTATKTFMATIKRTPSTYDKVNEATTEKFLNTCVVQYNYAKIGEAIKPFAGAIYQRSDGKWIYYYSWANQTTDSSLRTEIAVGSNCTAFLQKDGTINVYIGAGLKVYKYTMSKNETGKYQVNTLYTVISGITKYVELLDNKALVFTYDQYKIIDT